MLSGASQYAGFVYSLPQQHPGIQQMSVKVFPTGPRQGRAEGEIEFRGGLVLKVAERIDFDNGCFPYCGYRVRRGWEV